MKKKLGIVSTYDDLCGIAGYTRHIEPVLNQVFDVKVFDLNQFILRSTERRARHLGDLEIKNICDELKNYDAVNIQLEHGTLGIKPVDIVRRLEMLITASPVVSITFHTILKSPEFDVDQFIGRVIKFKIGAAINQFTTYRKNSFLVRRINNLIRREQCKRSVSVIVHTRRDANIYKIFQGFRNVFHHPLSFLTEGQRKSILATSERSKFSALKEIPNEDIIIGVFGFVGEYKGVDLAIRALRLLPDNYHLVIFGGVHPNSIRPGIKIDPYIEKLISLIAPKQTLLGELLEGKGGVELNVSAGDFAKLQDVDVDIRQDLSNRVHFAGALNDEDFASAIAISDIALLPYREVGQASSGPMSIANELGANVIAARTKAFMQFEKYHSGRMAFFEQGNYLELSKLIKARTGIARLGYPDKFNAASNRDVYIQAHLL